MLTATYNKSAISTASIAAGEDDRNANPVNTTRATTTTTTTPATVPVTRSTAPASNVASTAMTPSSRFPAKAGDARA